MLTQAIINEAVLRALQEDAPTGDITSETLIPESATATAQLHAREAGVFSGGQIFAAAFKLWIQVCTSRFWSKMAHACKPGSYSLKFLEVREVFFGLSASG